MTQWQIWSRLRLPSWLQRRLALPWLRTVAYGCILLCALPVIACTQSKSPAKPNPYQLIAAKYPDCEQQGQAMALYLDTGQPAIYDSFGWTDLRQAAQSLT